MNDVKNTYTTDGCVNNPVCVLPHKDVQRFLLDVIEQSNFPGKLVEFVSGVKDVIKNAAISSAD